MVHLEAGIGHQEHILFQNGHQPKEVIVHRPISVAENETRRKQEKVLKKHLRTKPNTNFEVWADHENEGRRLPHDIYSLPSLNLKRGDLEVKRYKEVMHEVYESGNGQQMLDELIRNWITTINLDHVATLLNFSQDEVRALIVQLETGKLPGDHEKPEDQGLDKSAEWYPKFLRVIGEDDIVPLVMMRTLILEGKGTASLRDLFIGLQRYIQREWVDINRLATLPAGEGISPQQVAADRMAVLVEERDQLFQELGRMNRSKKVPPNQVTGTSTTREAVFPQPAEVAVAAD